MSERNQRERRAADLARLKVERSVERCASRGHIARRGDPTTLVIVPSPSENWKGPQNGTRVASLSGCAADDDGGIGKDHATVGFHVIAESDGGLANEAWVIRCEMTREW